MAGALAAQAPDPFEDMAPPAPGGALAAAGGADYQDEGYPSSYDADQSGEAPTDDERYYRDTAQQLLGGAEGPLAQSARLRQSRDAAAQTKLAAIERAKANLRLLGSYAPNPFREMMAGLGQNTRTGRFGESVGNALAARQHALDARRAFETNMTGAQNELELAGGQVPWDAMNLEQQEADRQQRLGTQFATMAEREQTVRDAVRERRERFAADREQRRLVGDQTAAYREGILANQREAGERRRDALEQAKYTWQPGMGPDPDNKDKEVSGSWRFPNHGDEEPKFYPGVHQVSRTGTAGTALERNAQFYVANGIAPDVATAVSMLRQSVADPATFQRLVQAEKKIIMTTNFGMDDAVAEQQAIRNVRARAQAAAPPAANTAANPGFKTNITAPARPAAAPVQPAAAPVAAPAPAPAANGSALVLPPDVKARLKEGVGTTIRTPLGVVQQWTLQNGQPVQVK